MARSEKYEGVASALKSDELEEYKILAGSNAVSSLVLIVRAACLAEQKVLASDCHLQYFSTARPCFQRADTIVKKLTEMGISENADEKEVADAIRQIT